MLKINIFKTKFKKVNILTFKSVFETITEFWKPSNLYLVEHIIHTTSRKYEI